MGGGKDVVHGCSRMTVHPRVFKMPGRSTWVYTDQADIACSKREAKGELLGESHEA